MKEWEDLAVVQRLVLFVSHVVYFLKQGGYSFARHFACQLGYAVGFIHCGITCIHSIMSHMFYVVTLKSRTKGGTHWAISCQPSAGSSQEDAYHQETEEGVVRFTGLAHYSAGL